MEVESYTMQLNRTHLLFIPSHDPDISSGSVVQVCLRGDLGEGYMRILLKAGITDTCSEIYPMYFPSSKHP